jgi:hypothetical protein
MQGMHENRCLNDVLEFDIVNSEWRELLCSNKPKGRYRHIAAIIKDSSGSDHLFIAFGNDNTHRLNDMASLNLETRQWQKVSYTSDTPNTLLTHGCVVPSFSQVSLLLMI